LTAGSKAPIFDLTEEHAAVERAEMLEFYNMGIGFRAIADPTKSVHPPQHKPIGSVKQFAPA
jgi:phosphoribosylaminoimidazole (AIR) synthetase